MASTCTATTSGSSRATCSRSSRSAGTERELGADEAVIADRRAPLGDRVRADVGRADDVIDPDEAEPEPPEPNRSPGPAGPFADLGVNVAQSGDEAVEGRLRRRRIQVAQNDRRTPGRDLRVDPRPDRDEVVVPARDVDPDR